MRNIYFYVKVACRGKTYTTWTTKNITLILFKKEWQNEFFQKASFFEKMCQDSKQDKENHEIYTDLSFTIEHAIQGLADMIILIILFKPPVLDTFLRVFLDNIESPNLKQFSHHLGPHYGEPCG